MLDRLFVEERESQRRKGERMSQTIRGRASRRCWATLHGMAWPLLEEAEKKQIASKVAKGIDRMATPLRHGLGRSEA